MKVWGCESKAGGGGGRERERELRRMNKKKKGLKIPNCMLFKNEATPVPYSPKSVNAPFNHLEMKRMLGCYANVNAPPRPAPSVADYVRSWFCVTLGLCCRRILCYAILVIVEGACGRGDWREWRRVLAVTAVM